MSELPTDRADVVAFVDRVFRLMHYNKCPAADLSPFQGEAMGSLLARILPGDWSDRIPPITTGGRQVRLDNFILNNSYRSADPGLFLDIGCGYSANYDT